MMKIKLQTYYAEATGVKWYTIILGKRRTAWCMYLSDAILNMLRGETEELESDFFQRYGKE